MKGKNIAAIALVISLFAPHWGLEADETEKHNYMPAAGYVPDEETAIAIAVAVWKPIYGKDKIQEKKPYRAALKDGVWYVSGTIPQGWLGGVPEAEISKDSGQIIRVSHGK